MVSNDVMLPWTSVELLGVRNREPCSPMLLVLTYERQSQGTYNPNMLVCLPSIILGATGVHRGGDMRSQGTRLKWYPRDPRPPRESDARRPRPPELAKSCCQQWLNLMTRLRICSLGGRGPTVLVARQHERPYAQPVRVSHTPLFDKVLATTPRNF